jgi:GH15 family glucan-1,4-alpha-glucosidase
MAPNSLRNQTENFYASLLLILMVGFLPPEDPPVRGTLRAIEDRLLIDGEFVLRYETKHAGDGLPQARDFSWRQLLARRQPHIAVPLWGSAQSIHPFALTPQRDPRPEGEPWLGAA